jgi:EmrB/QacA subfamily drug resistance transporter
MFGETITDRRMVPVRILGLVGVLLGQFMLVLDATVVNVALPEIQRDLQLGPHELTWVSSAYLIAFGGLLLLFGRLGDELGRRRVFRVGVVTFTLASVACGLAPNALLLIAARFTQGIGAAAASSVILAIIATEFPRPDDRARAMSGYMFVSVAGGSVGLFVGGLLTELLGWSWIFWINVPVGIVALELVRRHLRAEERTPRKGPIDVLGALLVTSAAMLVIYGLLEAGVAGWSAPVARVAFAVALVVTVLFFAVEAQRAHPLLPMRMLRIRSLVVTSVVRGFMAMALFGMFFIATLDMPHTLHFTPLRVGLAFLPQTLTVAALSLGGSAWLVRRFGPVRVLVIGLSIAALGIGIMADLAIDAPYFPVRAAVHVLLGLGFGMSFLPLLTLAMADVPPRDAGLGSAIVNLSLQLAGAVGIAVLVTAASYRTHALVATGASIAESTVHGFRFAEAVAVVALLVGITVAATQLRGRKAAP